MYAKYSEEVNQVRGSSKSSAGKDDKRATSGSDLNPAEVKELERLWERLQNPPPGVVCKSLLKRHLTPQIYSELKGRKSRFGGTLAECIRSGEKK